MFEDLKARPRGFAGKEKARLYVTVGACLVLGSMIYGGRGCAEGPEVQRPAAKPDEPKKPTTHALDPTPLEGLRATCGGGAAFDGPALAYVISEVLKGTLQRAPDLRLGGPAEVLALDCKTAIGKAIEVSGTVRTLDQEEYKAEAPLADGSVDRLWSFALEDEAGKRIVVVHAGLGSDTERGKPYDAWHPGSGRSTLDDGDRVSVRGIYLQRRTGTIGGVALGEPTPVLVGQEYRRTIAGATAPAALASVDWSGVVDRDLEDTRSLDSHRTADHSDVVQEDAYYQVLAWARATGHDAIAKQLKDGTLPSHVWGAGEFHRWSAELKGDDDHAKPDTRSWTNANRGKVFWTSGIVGEFDKEDWDTVPPNRYGVGERWNLWLLSDFYGGVLLPFDGAFPLSEFPKVLSPRERSARQRVVVYGIFYKNFSFRPAGAYKRPDRVGEITVPAFILLHIEPAPAIRAAPLLENPFFWVWTSLLVFGGVFFYVMNRVEKKEAGALRDQHLRIKRRLRDLDAASGAGGSGKGGGAGEGGGGAAPEGAGPPGEATAGGGP